MKCATDFLPLHPKPLGEVAVAARASYSCPNIGVNFSGREDSCNPTAPISTGVLTKRQTCTLCLLLLCAMNTEVNPFSSSRRLKAGNPRNSPLGQKRSNTSRPISSTQSMQISHKEFNYSCRKTLVPSPCSRCSARPENLARSCSTSPLVFLVTAGLLS